MSKTIKVWEPRYHDRVVLVAWHRVEDDVEEIELTKGAYKGVYPITADEIASYPLGSNGSIPCYEVDLDRLLGNE